MVHAALRRCLLSTVTYGERLLPRHGTKGMGGSLVRGVTNCTLSCVEHSLRAHTTRPLKTKTCLYIYLYIPVTRFVISPPKNIYLYIVVTQFFISPSPLAPIPSLRWRTQMFLSSPSHPHRCLTYQSMSCLSYSIALFCCSAVKVAPAGHSCPLANQVSSKGSYVVTGGTGGIGLELALRFARAGAGGIVLLSR